MARGLLLDDFVMMPVVWKHVLVPLPEPAICGHNERALSCSIVLIRKQPAQDTSVVMRLVASCYSVVSQQGGVICVKVRDCHT